MIQRIQTVYLLIVAILMVLMMSFPIGFFYTEAAVAEMSNLSVALPDGALDYTPDAGGCAVSGNHLPVQEADAADSPDIVQLDCTDRILRYSGFLCIQHTEGIRKLHLFVDRFLAGSIYHPELAGYPCHRKG